MASTTWSLLMMFVVLAAIPLVLWALKRLQTIRPAGGGALPMQVAAQLALGPRERVVMLRVGDRQLLLGVTPQQITLLADDEAAPRPPASASPASTSAFSSVLRANVLRATGAKPPAPGTPE